MEYNVQYSTQSPVASLFTIALVVLVIVALWKIFEKAGEPGWKALIPFYNINLTLSTPYYTRYFANIHIC